MRSVDGFEKSVPMNLGITPRVYSFEKKSICFADSYPTIYLKIKIWTCKFSIIVKLKLRERVAVLWTMGISLRVKYNCLKHGAKQPIKTSNLLLVY